MNWVYGKRTQNRASVSRDGWVVKWLPVSRLWIATFRGVLYQQQAWATSQAAMDWVDINPEAQAFAASVIKEEYK